MSVINLGGDVLENVARQIRRLSGSGKKAIKDHPHVPLFGGFALGALDLGFTIGTAQKGKLAQGVTSSLGGSIGGSSGAGLGTLIGSAVPIPGLNFALGIAGGIIGSQAGKAVGLAINLEKNQFRTHLGGNYTDTDYAYTMRMRASQEMGRSLLNARKWLGSEGVMFHN